MTAGLAVRVLSTDEPSLEELKLSPEVAWYLQSRGIPMPTCPPAYKTPEPRDVPGAVFDDRRVDKVLAAFEELRHTQGKWAGRPLKPDPWQVAYILAPVFGWIHPDPDWNEDDDPERRMVRIIRKLYVEVPRKNGKSTILGGIGLYLTGGDGEDGAQVLCAAVTKDQAGFVFTPIKQLVEKSPGLKGPFRAVGSKILHRKSGSYMGVISNVADAQHGANLHGSIIDELHVHKDAGMLDVLESGTGSRTQPLTVIITTADENKTNSVYDLRRRKIEQLADGINEEPSQYGVIWCAPADADPFVEETWAMANPGYGISPTRAYMRSAAESAKNTPSELPRFLRLHLGIRISDIVKWLPLDRYDATGQMVDDEEWRDMVAWGGLDLSTSADFTAFTLRGHDPVHGHPIRSMCWLPEEQLAAMEKLTGQPLSEWHKAGWLRLTEGNVVDYGQVARDIIEEVDRLGVELHTVAYDPWNASSTVQALETEGYQMVPVRQGYANLSAPSKTLQTYVLGSTPQKPLIRTGGNPILRWMADCLQVRQDDNGNIKPVKPDRGKSSSRIDGWVAAIMAEREAMAEGIDEETGGDSYFDALTTAMQAKIDKLDFGVA